PFFPPFATIVFTSGGGLYRKAAFTVVSPQDQSKGYLMHYPPIFSPKTLVGLVMVQCLSAIGLQAGQVDIPGNVAVSPPLGYPGGSLKGEYWKRPLNTIFVD